MADRHKAWGQFHGQTAHIFFAVLDDNLVHMRVHGSGGAAERHRATCLCLQAQRRKLKHMGHRDRVIVPRGLEKTDLRESSPHTRLKPFQLVDAGFFDGAGHHRLNRSVVAP